MDIDVMYYEQLGRISYRDALRVLEDDIQHANALAIAIPKAKGGSRLQMKLVYHDLAPSILFLLSWIDDCSCACLVPRYLNIFQVLIYKVYPDGRRKASKYGRKASIREFYAIILPSLQQLHHNLVELNGAKVGNFMIKGIQQKRSEEDEECGICLETCAKKMVTPTCCHAMCINCYREWSTRSESCPFCRGSLRRVRSTDLWVLTGRDELVDPDTATVEDLRRFYLYISSLPKDLPDALFLMYYEYLI